MHFVVQTVQTKFPEILNFDSELRFLEKAAVGKFKLCGVYALFAVSQYLANRGRKY